MLRDPSLVPLSRQHQHALALCVRIERALRAHSADLDHWQAEAARDFAQEIQFHFDAEEQFVFPAARRFQELLPLVDELVAEHGRLRQYFARAHDRSMDTVELAEFVTLLSSHIRKEERQLFESLQKTLPERELAKMGAEVEQQLKNVVRACQVQFPTQPRAR